MAPFFVALVRRRRTAPDDNGVRLEALVALVYALVVFFALTYLSLATREDEFVDLHNSRQMKVGYPGHFYVPPYFTTRTPHPNHP